MTLSDAITALDSLDSEDLICARRPWTPTSDCIVTPTDQPAGVPKHVKVAGLEYFIDAGTAREALEVFGGRETTLEERLRLLIFYAENDAFPDWVYEG